MLVAKMMTASSNLFLESIKLNAFLYMPKGTKKKE